MVVLDRFVAGEFCGSILNLVMISVTMVYRCAPCSTPLRMDDGGNPLRAACLAASNKLGHALKNSPKFMVPRRCACVAESKRGNKGARLRGRTLQGGVLSKGRSRHLLETPFSEPLLRTPSQNCKTHSRPPSRNPSENPSPESFPKPSQNPSRTLCCRTTP